MLPRRSITRSTISSSEWAELESVDDAIAFIQTLSAEDRERLARSPTPLARFADVKTPEEIMERFMSLDMNARLQVLAMFDKTQ